MRWFDADAIPISSQTGHLGGFNYWWGFARLLHKLPASRIFGYQLL